jgi:hypothetical protein
MAAITETERVVAQYATFTVWLRALFTRGGDPSATDGTARRVVASGLGTNTG